MDIEKKWYMNKVLWFIPFVNGITIAAHGIYYSVYAMFWAVIAVCGLPLGSLWYWTRGSEILNPFYGYVWILGWLLGIVTNYIDGREILKYEKKKAEAIQKESEGPYRPKNLEDFLNNIEGRKEDN